jgi:hypothetical protein
VIEVLDEGPELRGGRPFGDAGRASDVREQDADLDLGATRDLPDLAETGIAEERVRAGRAVHDDTRQHASEAAKGRSTQLAPG